MNTKETRKKAQWAAYIVEIQGTDINTVDFDRQCRLDINALCDEVDAQQEEIKRLRKLLQFIHEACNAPYPLAIDNASQEVCDAYDCDMDAIKSLIVAGLNRRGKE